MEDRYQTLINSIKILKENQNRKEKDIQSTLSKFQSDKEGIKKSNEKIIEIANQLKEVIAKAEEDKKSLIEEFVNVAKEKKIEESKPEKNQIDNIKSDKNQNQRDTRLSYKKFYNRKSILTILLHKPTYQAMYNFTFSFLILYAIIFIFNLYLGKPMNILQTSNEQFYLNGLFDFCFYFLIKVTLLLSLVVITTIPIGVGLYFVPGLLIAIVILIFHNHHLFDTSKFSSVLRILHYWDNLTFILKILAYYFEKRLYVSYKLYNAAHSIPINILRNYSLIIIDKGDDNEIIFEFKQLNLMREILNFCRFYYLPTLIYRDSYPVENRNTSKMIKSLINCLLCIGLIFFALEVHLIPMMSNVKDFTSPEKVSSMLISFLLYSLLGLFVIVFSLLHSFSNFTSEMLSFGDKYFYGDFFNSKTPKECIKKLAYVYEDFFLYYLIPIFLMIFPDFQTKYYKKFFKDVMTIIFFSIIFDYIVFSLIQTQSPIISISLFGCLLCSYPLEYFTNDNVYLVNWLIISLGIGITAVSITSERVIIMNKLIDLKSLSLFDRIIPKIFYFLFHPAKLL